MPRTFPQRVLDWSQRILSTCLQLLFPSRCAGCNQPADVWCRDCIQRIERISGQLCSLCGSPTRGGSLCSSCRDEAPDFQARSYAWYRGPLMRALVQLKYRPNRQLSNWMADRLVEIFKREGWPNLTVVPVPLSRNKLMRRGYNQVDLIASETARKLALPYKPTSLRRIKETPSQVGLTPAARRENVRDAFQAEPDLVREQSMLLIDDLYTTGATLSCCTQALMSAGATQVFALTVARAEYSKTSVMI